MAIEQSNTRKRYPKFETEQRRQVVVDMLNNSRTTREEFRRNAAQYKEMEIPDVDTLHSLLMNIGNQLFDDLKNYYHMDSQRTKINTLIQQVEDGERDDISEEQLASLRKAVELTDQQQEILEGLGFDLDHDFSRLSKGRKTKNPVPDVSAEFGDILASNGLETLLMDQEG